MCGIFGLIVKPKSSFNSSEIMDFFEEIARISIARGKDSSGVMFKNDRSNSIQLLKGDLPIFKLLKAKEYLKFRESTLENYNNGGIFQAMGHARLVTNGSQLIEINNQPVVKDTIIGIHNGIIVNDAALWGGIKNFKREYDIDTEVLITLIKENLEEGKSMKNSLVEAYSKIEGTASTGLLFSERSEMILSTNNGSLYYIHGEDLLVFASEEYFLKKLIRRGTSLPQKISQLAPNHHLLLNTVTFEFDLFSQEIINNCKKEEKATDHSPYVLVTKSLKGEFNSEMVIDPNIYLNNSTEKPFRDLLENNTEKISKLKRCSRCILPSSFPHIEFDDSGVCNYCNNYRVKPIKHNLDDLRELVKPYRRSNGIADCIVPFSGGRDSTYSLHLIKKELQLNPIAFTYDWGLVTDLARRNIARVCGKLGVENIVVSANIQWKRENIRKNILAWMKYPQLGMIPLFMAGDKFFFYYCERVKKQTGIDLNIWGINHLENTDFKTGFAGVKPNFNKKRIYSLSIKNQLQLFNFVGKNVIRNPMYFNQSVLDSLGSFASRYLSPKKDYFHLFDYYKWNESELENLILKEYKWEKAIDTDSTWRIGDGTVSFYNYIYYTVAGFTENDTFRSNQIREGQISREFALQKVHEENRVRYETLRWYLSIVGIDFIDVIKVINSIPKLY